MLRDSDNGTDSGNDCQYFTPSVAATVPRFKFADPTDEIDSAIQAFLSGATAGKFGRYVIDGARLCYRLVVTEKMRLSHDKAKRNAEFSRLKDLEAARQLRVITEKFEHTYEVEFMALRSNTIAMRVTRPTEIIYLANSAALPLIGRSVAFGRERLNRMETDVQSRLALLVPMIPFSVFDQANLKLANVNIVARGTAETITRKIADGLDKKTREPKFKDESAHFTGASLFEIDGRYFLFDIDRREIDHKIFNPFLVELVSPATSIADAYEGLKPAIVKAALAEGFPVQRQGEWFFVPMANVDAKPATRRGLLSAGRSEPMPFILRAGDNRPNNAAEGVEIDGRILVRGKVSHSGREHEDLTLAFWHLAVPNTATRSFTITGDID